MEEPVTDTSTIRQTKRLGSAKRKHMYNIMFTAIAQQKKYISLTLLLKGVLGPYINTYYPPPPVPETFGDFFFKCSQI